MYMLFYLEQSLAQTVRVPAPSDLLLRIKNTLCSIRLCTALDKSYCPVVGSTVIDLSAGSECSFHLYTIGRRKWTLHMLVQPEKF